MADLLAQGVASIRAQYERKALSPVEVFTQCAQRIENFNAAVNAFAHLDLDRAAEKARESEERWRRGEPLSPIDGIPTTIKDIFWCTDWEATYGSHVFTTRGPSDEDAPCVARLKEAGAVLLGVTTSPESGWKGVTDSPRYGNTNNPWDTSKTPGGSSGGAAAAAVLGMGLLHIGSDAGGSIRIPSSFSGVFGHKPSFGRVPAYPASPFGTVSHVGPIARDVRDAAGMLDIISRPDARDWYALPHTGESFSDGLEGGIQGLRIAYCAAIGGMAVDSEVAECVAREARVFERLGATVEEIDLAFPGVQELFHTLWFAGAARRVESLSEEERKRVDPGLIDIAGQGARIGLSEYLNAVQEREKFGIQMRRLHEQYDLLVTPAMPITAFDVGQEVPNPADGARWTDWTGFTYPFNLTQQPACSIPCGVSDGGLPIGLQIVGPMHADASVLRAAYAYEQTREWELPDSPITRPNG